MGIYMQLNIAYLPFFSDPLYWLPVGCFRTAAESRSVAVAILLCYVAWKRLVILIIAHRIM